MQWVHILERREITMSSERKIRVVVCWEIINPRPSTFQHMYIMFKCLMTTSSLFSSPAISLTELNMQPELAALDEP
jgi:hypothetical protein